MKHLLKQSGGVFVDSHPEGLYAIFSEVFRNLFSRRKDKILLGINNYLDHRENLTKAMQLLSDGTMKLYRNKVFPFLSVLEAYTFVRGNYV
jgi:hypothetical protein